MSSRRTHSSETLLSAVARFSPEQPTYWPPPSTNYHDASGATTPNEHSSVGPSSGTNDQSGGNGVSGNVAKSLSLTNDASAQVNLDSNQDATSRPADRQRAHSAQPALSSSSAAGSEIGTSSLLQRRKSSSASQRPKFALTDLKLELNAISPPPLVIAATSVAGAEGVPAVAQSEPATGKAISGASVTTIPASVADLPLPLPVALPPPGESLDAHLAQLQLDDTIREEVIGESSAAVTPLPLDEDGKPISLAKQQQSARPTLVERAFRSTKTHVATPLPDLKKRYFDSDEDEDEDEDEEEDHEQGEEGEELEDQSDRSEEKHA